MYMEKKRNVTYDYLRGFAMLSIVIGHLYYYAGRSEGSWALMFVIQWSCQSLCISVACWLMCQ